PCARGGETALSPERTSHPPPATGKEEARGGTMGSPTLIAEVAPSYGLVPLQVGARTVQCHRSHLEYVRGARELERDVGVLLDDEHRHPFLVELADDAEDLRDDDRRQPERRLVEEEEPRLLHERLRKRQHLLLAAAERA